MPSPTDTTVPTSSTSTPCVMPASWALMSCVISCALISAMFVLLSPFWSGRGECVQGRAGFLETPGQRGIQPRAADRHDESAEESRVDGRHEPDGFLRPRDHEGAKRLEDLGVRGLSRHDARLDGPRVAIQMRANGGEQLTESGETPVVKEDGQEA